VANTSFGKRLDRVEAAVAPKYDPVIVFECGEDVPREEVDAFIRDELRPNASQLVVQIKRFREEGGDPQPRRIAPYAERPTS
jgi:hypothetical protein